MQKTFAGTFFIALFYSLLAVFHYVTPADWTIHEWNGVISWATAENLDIGRRIYSFYKSFAVFFISFFIMLSLLHRFGSKYFTESEIHLLNYISLAGCMLLFFKLIGVETHESLMLIFVMQLLVLIYACGDYFLSAFSRTQSLPVHELAWSVITGACVFFLIDYFLQIFGYDPGKYFNKWLFVLSAVALHFCFWSKRGRFKSFYKWMILLRYVALIPLWFVLSEEIYMILNQHSIFSIAHSIIFILLLLITFLLIARSYRKESSALEQEPRAITAIASFYFPWMIVGLIAFTYYRPVVEAPVEMFEQANPALSIQQYYEFGKLPWLQTFSSHSGADFLTGFLYSMLNGFTGLSYHCYDFLATIIYVLLLYYTIYKLTDNAYLAFLSVFIYPYVNLLIPSYHNIMLVPLLILAATLKVPSAKNYFLLFSSLILMPLWRYDLGYGNIVALLASLFIFMILRKDLRASFPALTKGFLYSLILPLILFGYALAKSKQSILINLKDALGYLNSGQAFGIKDLANDMNLVYYVHYFIFPCAVGACLIFAFYKLVTLSKKEEKLPFINVAILFLSIYYFANFHRGLIRHNLAEGWDTAFTSFGFLIVTATVYDFLRTKNKLFQLATACAFASLILAEFKYPQPELSKNNYYSEVVAVIKSPVFASISKDKINRAPVQADFAKETFNDLKSFLDKNIPSDATFLDFSNTPMLYLYMHRQTPNYFNQIPHTAVNFYLQQRFLEELKNYKIPVVLFSNNPVSWWDSFDGIPNTYRHYLIAEYIYKHYQPYTIIDHHTIWLEKGNKLLSENHPEYPKDSVSEQPKDQQLKFLPYVMGQSYPVVINDSVSLLTRLMASASTIDEKNAAVINLAGAVKGNEANYVLIKAKNLSSKREDVRLSFGNNEQVNGCFSFYLKEDSEEHSYLIRFCTQYNWYGKENNFLHLNMQEGKCLVTELNLIKGKAEE